jgi:RNA polymerase sigma-70 factor, ECF subfamily
MQEEAMQAHAVLTASERPTDTELIARILSGDMRALETLMRLHNRTLYRTARAILRDDAEAEDAVQEAYLQAYRALGTFRGESKLSTWLVRITANEALMRRRRKPKAAMASTDVEPDNLVSYEAGPEGEAQRGETRRLLEARIDALPDPFRAVFVLRAVEELTVEETAAALGIPDATVRTRYFRARRLLREWMAGDIDTTLEDAFAFAGTRCDRIVREVLAGLRVHRVDSKIRHTVTAMLLAAVAAASLAGCSEKPPRSVPEGEQAYNGENGDSPLRERTLKQGESGRMNY